MKTLPYLCLFFALSALPHAEAGPQISAFNYGGSGCPQGSVQAVLAPDGSALSIIYSNFVANVNANQRADARDCTVTLKIRKPVIQAYILESADFRGFVGLEAGVSARQQVNVQNGFGRFLLNQQFGFNMWEGPVSQNYMIQSVKPVSLNGNSVDCANQLRADTKMEFKTKVRLESRNGGQGMFTVDSTDGRLQQIYRFKLINCLGGGGFPFPFPR